MNSLKLNSLLNRLKSNKLIADSFWSLLGNVLGKGLALVAGIVVARFLGKDIYGEYGIIRNTILTIGIFSTFGLGYTSTKYIADYKNNSPYKIRLFTKYANQITLFFSGIMSLLLAIFANQISIYFFNVDNLGTPLRILSVLIIFNAITTTQIGIMAGFGKFKELAKINSIIGVLTFIFSICLTYFLALNGALLALLIVQIINCIYNYVIVRENILLTVDYLKKDSKLFKEILSFSTPIALQEFIYSATSWLSSILLIKYSNIGELGMYSAIMQWVSVILFIPGILRNVVLSHLSSSSEDKNQHHKILKNTIKINLVSTLIPCLIIVLFSTVIENSYGKTFNGLGILLSIAVFSTVFTSVSNVFAQAYTSLGKNWIMLIFRTLRDVFIILCFLILVVNFRIEGSKSLILSNVFISVLFLIIMFIFYKKINKNDIIN